MSNNIAQEKVAQAIELLREKDIDAWMTFTRESDSSGEPALELILDSNVTWLSAFIVTKTGESIAIVGQGDVQAVTEIGSFAKVIGYLQSVKEPLVQELTRIAPRQIALNYSKDNFSADGLSHGMFLLLQDMLAGTGLAERFISADSIVAPLRGRKSKSELAAIANAVKQTEKILDEIPEIVRPGMTEAQIAAAVKERMEHYGVEPAWDANYCPGVYCGPDSPLGHCFPTDIPLQPGQTLVLDFGLRINKYSADLQRTWYVLRPGENQAPPEAKQKFADMLSVLDTAFGALKPGATGYEVDTPARARFAELGLPEPGYAMGHELGRAAHDGTIVLGPRWQRYGSLVDIPMDEGNTFAVESGFKVPGVGAMHFEQDVLITKTGAEYISTPQRELYYIKSR